LFVGSFPVDAYDDTLQYCRITAKSNSGDDCFLLHSGPTYYSSVLLVTEHAFYFYYSVKWMSWCRTRGKNIDDADDQCSLFSHVGCACFSTLLAGRSA